MFHKINYHTKGNGICGSDMNNNYTDSINISLISSLSELEPFNLPFSNTHKGNYAVLTMNNKDKYYITENSFLEISEILTKTTQNA